MMIEQHQSFEGIKHLSDDGLEYWSARELSPLLEYRDWRNFENVIIKAKKACEISKHEVLDHFVEATIMLPLGSVSQIELDAVHLS
ncbi:DNA damage-inducible protein D, partial [Pseudomonas aeruginosa]